MSRTRRTEPPLRVLHCLWTGGIGGAERSVYQLVREQLRDPEISPAVLFAGGRGPYYDAARASGCPVVTLDLPHGHAAVHLGRVVRAMRPFDVHHFHSPEPLLMAASTAVIGVRRVYTQRGGVTDYNVRKRLRHRLVGAFLRSSSTAIAANTRHAAAAAGTLFRLGRREIAVVYNGVDFDSLCPSQPAADVRAATGLPADAFVIGTVANLKPWKRIDRILAAAARLDEHAAVLVVGDGPDRRRLEEHSRALGIEGRTFFVGAQSNVADYLQLMDVFCLASTALESFGNAAVEAMAAGLPAIVFGDGGGVVEHIQPDRTGFVVDDDRELDAVLRRLLADPGARRTVGARAAESVRARYPLSAAAAAYKALYLGAPVVETVRQREAAA